MKKMSRNPEDEVAIEDETTTALHSEEEDSKDKTDISSVGKGKIRSNSADDGDRSYSSNNKQPLDGSRKDKLSLSNSNATPPEMPVVTQPVFSPPWPEWSDDFINAETWDVDSDVDYFEDVFEAMDFLNLKVYDWLRPSEFMREPPSVVKLNSTVIDLITPNAHLCEKSEVLRYILSEISELYDYGIENNFVECEGEGVAYVPNYSENYKKWTPWSHIYSCCKAGIRGEKPHYNSKGKYYVRLYFLGSWRRILIDDRIPVLPSGLCALPLTASNELWPLLLTKALLKIAIVTWKGDDVKKFSAISALTGWVFEWIDSIDGVSEEELWGDLENTLPKYKDPKKIPSCYTLLHPSRKKQKFGQMDETDTFWWMPPVPVHPNELEDAILKQEAEDQPFELDLADIITNVVHPVIEKTASGEDITKPVLEVRWRRKTETQTPPERRKSAKAESPHAIETSKVGEEHADASEADEDKNELTPTTADAMVVGKKKKKKGGIGLALDDSKSEKKSVKKHPKKTKDTLDERRKQSKPEFHRKKSRAVSAMADWNDSHETATDVQDEEQEEENKAPAVKSMKIKPSGVKNWTKLKNILLGDDDMPPRMSKSLRRSVLDRIEVVKPSKHHRKGHGVKDNARNTVEHDVVEESSPVKTKKVLLPTVPEILYGVQKFAGIDYRNIVKNWEKICGKDFPVSLTVVLKQFPTSEEENLETPMPLVPAFLQHPIQLTEVRDTVLRKQSDRPETPLWKRFRWKQWAMKKGLIPMEEDRTNEVIRTVKVKTPFMLKKDWYDFNSDNLEYTEEHEEFDGEDDDDDFDYGGDENGLVAVNTFFFSLVGVSKKKKSHHHDHHDDHKHSPAATPPPTKAPSPPAQPGRQSSIVQAQQAPSPVKPYDPAHYSLVPPPTKQGSKKSISAQKSGTLATIEGALDVSHQTRKSTPTVVSDKKSLEGNGSNTTVILHEAEVVLGESDEDFDDDGFKRRMLNRQDSIYPTGACASLWFNCSDIAKNLLKFCKFYTSQSVFGSCYILRREPDIQETSSSLFYDIHSDLPKYPEALTEYKQKKDILNLAIEFDRCKSYHVTDYQMDDREGIESAFYLFSDCWTEQELIITVHVLQENYLKEYNRATTSPKNEEVPPGPPPTPLTTGGASTLPDSASNPEDVPLTLVIEPWDWRLDNCVTRPLLLCTWINDRWISHISLPAGRNTFRIWLFYQEKISSAEVGGRNKSARDSSPTDSPSMGSLKKTKMVPFSVRIVSQTPIYVGSRAEVLNYMTNPPMLFLKQCERLANNIWGLFACFGKQRSAYEQNIRQLRHSYCPAYSTHNMINKFVRGAHETFEDLFVSLVTLFNNGTLDRMLVLTLRVLFLNPRIGRNFFPKHVPEKGEEMFLFRSVFRGLGKKGRVLLTSACIIIQRYYRGWRVRRLFQLRKKSHPDFKKIEYNVRRIAHLLAKETDSFFAQRNAETGEFYGGNTSPSQSVADLQVDPDKVPPTILPTPPHWSVDMLKYLVESHPWLITIHPHAHCVPHHVKIQELEGELPERVKFFAWYPFFREVLKVPHDSKSCFVELDLQVYPPLGIHLKVINNDNGKVLKTVSNRLFIGRLFENKRGYTVICFRWTTPTLKQEMNDRPGSTNWKLRLITPHEQDGPRFQTRKEFLSQKESGEDVNLLTVDFNANVETKQRKSVNNRTSVSSSENKRESVPLLPEEEEEEEEEESEQFPSQLCLRRLTGYYTPNKDYSVCQYIFETNDKRATVSLRFLASNKNVKLRVLVWDCTRKNTVFDEICEGGLVAPVIQLHFVKQKPKSPEESLEEASVEELHSPIGDEMEESNSAILNVMMSTTNLKNISETSVEDEDIDLDVNEGGSQLQSPESQTDEDNTGMISNASSKAEGSVADLENKPQKISNKRRFIISVYVVEDTWPLSDRELLYVLYREQKFFKNIKMHHCKERKKQKEEIRKKAAEEAAAAAEASESQQIVDVPQSEQNPSTVGPLVPATSTGENTGLALGEQSPQELKKEMQPTKRRTKRKDGGGATAENIGNITAALASTPPNAQTENPTSPAYPATPPPSTVSPNFNNGEDLNKEKNAGADKKGKIKRKMNGNLQIKYGGRQSQSVKHLDQPHWILDIVTDSKVKYKLKSNWQVLKKRLLQAQDSWYSGGVELIYQDLNTRLDFLLESMVEENYAKVKQKKFSVACPIVGLFSHLRVDDYDLKSFPSHEVIYALIQAWSVNPEENQKAGEKFLQNRLKKVPKIVVDSETVDPTILQLLNFIPKNLRRLAETFLQRIKERERQLQQNKFKTSSPDEDVEDNEEEDEEARKYNTIAAIAELPTDTLGFSEGDGKTSRQSQSAIPASGARTPNQATWDSKTEKTTVKKGKKNAAAASKPIVEENVVMSAPVKQPIGKKGVADKQKRGSTKAPTVSKTQLAEQQQGKSYSGDKSAGASDNKEDVDSKVDDYESELDRIREFGHVREILKKYDAFFFESKSIREVLVAMVEGEIKQKIEGGPKKLLLSKTGISKYKEKSIEGDGKSTKHAHLDHGVEEAQEDRRHNHHHISDLVDIVERQTKESMVANKLLRWAYDYSFLPPSEEQDEVIKDPGELPMFLMRTLVEEQKIRQLQEEEMAAEEEEDE